MDSLLYNAVSRKRQGPSGLGSNQSPELDTFTPFILKD